MERETEWGGNDNKNKKIKIFERKIRSSPKYTSSHVRPYQKLITCKYYGEILRIEIIIFYTDILSPILIKERVCMY